MISVDLLGLVKYPLLFWCVYAGHVNGWQALLYFLFVSHITVSWKRC